MPIFFLYTAVIFGGDTVEITNPYTFNIADPQLILKVNTLPVPDGHLLWPITQDAFGRSLLAATYTFTIPDGITSIQVFMTTNTAGDAVSNIRIQNVNSRKYWFDNINVSYLTTPVIEVTPGKEYFLTLGGTAPIEDGGQLQLRYSNEINKAPIDTSDK